MNSSDSFEAQVTCDDYRVKVTIDPAYQLRTGISTLQWELCDDSSSSRSSAGKKRGRLHVKASNLLEKLEGKKERLKELAEATEKRVHELRVKKQLLGSAFLAGEVVELKQAEKELFDYNQSIYKLDRQIRDERKRSSDESPSYTK